MLGAEISLLRHLHDLLHAKTELSGVPLVDICSSSARLSIYGVGYYSLYW